MERLSCRHVFYWIIVVNVVQVQCDNRGASFADLIRPRNNETWCQYRDTPFKYDKNTFRLQSCAGCYHFAQPARFYPGMIYRSVTIQAPNGFYYQGMLVNDTAYDIDYLNPISVALVKTSMRPEHINKWTDCCRSGDSCCDRMLVTPNQHPGEDCPATWDGWDCWDEANHDESRVCPAHIFSGSSPSCYHYSIKYCSSDGEWNQTTNYVPCNLTIRLIERHRYHVILLSISLAVMFPAIVIFFVYRKLRKSMRVILIRNLLIAITTRNIFTIIYKETIILNALTSKDSEVSAMEENGVWCKMVTVSEKLAMNAVYASMLLLGVFLHRLIAAAFRGEPKMFWYFIAGVVVTCLPVMALTIVTAITNDTNCWAVSQNGTQWINDSFRVAMLAINVVLMLDITRVLVTKLRGVQGGNSLKIRQTIKATLLLVPVFGIQFIFTASRPNTTNCTNEQIFYYFNYTFDGMQGAMVAFLFCYLNNEVQILLKRSSRSRWEKIRARHDPDYRPKTRDARKTTFSTLVELNLQRLDAPPTPILDTRCYHPSKSGDQPEFHTPRPSTVSSAQFYTPHNSVAGSPTDETSQFYYTPKGSITSFDDGGFFDCYGDTDTVDDEGIVNQGFQLDKPVQSGQSDTYA